MSSLDRRVTRLEREAEPAEPHLVVVRRRIVAATPDGPVERGVRQSHYRDGELVSPTEESS